MALVFGSVCSGIEAASVAWAGLGWSCAFVSEIEAFPRAVLKHHYPETPLHGDFTTIEAGRYRPIDLLVGGTPCQSFSVAGLRGGLSDERGNLTLEYLRLAGRLRPRWLVWENVPGVFSSLAHDAPPDPGPPPIDLDAGDGPRDGEEIVVEDEYDSDESHAFVSFLAGLSDLGYGFAYRVLDAQFAGVPQRRRRVFVVGYLGDWRRAAAVLLERHSLQGIPPPRRETGQGIACSPEGIAGNVSSKWAKGTGGPAGDEHYNLIVAGLTASDGGVSGKDCAEGRLVAATLAGGGRRDGGYSLDDVPLTPDAVAFKASHFTRDKDGAPSSIAPPLSADADKGDQDTLVLAPASNPGRYECQACGEVFDDAFADEIGGLAPVECPRCGEERRLYDRFAPLAFDVKSALAPHGSGQGGPVTYPLAATGHKDQQVVAYRTSGNCGAWETGDKTDALTTGTDPFAHVIAFSSKDHGGDAEFDLSPTLRAGGHDTSHANAGVPPAIAFALRGREGGAMPEVEGGGDQVGALRAASGGSSRDYVAIPLLEIGKGSSSRGEGRNGAGFGNQGDPMFTLQAAAQHGVFIGGATAAAAFDLAQITRPSNRSTVTPGAPAGPLNTRGEISLASASAVRRLTPRECERLQGFPDDYTLIPWRGGVASDGPRYRALGNTMAVPVMRWIGERIAAVEALDLPDVGAAA